jgi:hypothetical protein
MMKFRSAAVAAAALAAITLLAGCNKAASNTSSTNSNSTGNAGATTSPSVKPTATSNTTTSSDAGTPTDAFKTYYNAIKNKDVEAVKALFSRATLKALEDKARAANKSPDDVFKEGLESASAEIPATMPETRNEKIEGDRATLEIKDDKKGSWDTIRFVREDGQWKMSFAETEPTGDEQK